MSVVAVVPAAGSGQRLGAALPKAFVPVGGVPILLRAVDGLLRSGVVDRVVVAVPAGQVGAARSLLAGRPVVVIVGGSDRTGSVRNALHAMDGASGGERAHGGERAGTRGGDAHTEDFGDIVLVHDAARPLTPPELTAAVVAAIRSGRHAVVPVLPLADTVKQVDGDGRVHGTVDRSVLRAVQTPQGFTRALLERAYDAAGSAATDDAGLVEALGESVHTVPGHASAFKITTPWDLQLAEMLLARTPEAGT
ncbi:2-C-methyl-D-erythritol 4-phosphate cytidylyltransferase [Pseudonocardia bannensis]|uniref:2-C-methyl-D-erythritol 4-phosphate cytidylyltransferase n=1 Tax=Pseudonocardia bannensis TaxID=630973 RepID=A0A848DP48_9PSEU|nr:2-C-methyl-D-erythritol 4-phosphate cytidylyltransferase [Pseudonocardia bannensis]NMH94236.1 2-C-methyl-D-erythritol 4-phosphate cytidylyltransferase [Pseudonocardia bannensis]